MSISVSNTPKGIRIDMMLGARFPHGTLTITGLTAGADNTVQHNLGFAPDKLSYRPAKDGTTPGGWTETQLPDASNLYITVNANGSTSGKVDYEGRN